MTFCSVPLFSSNSYAEAKISSDLTVYQNLRDLEVNVLSHFLVRVPSSLFFTRNNKGKKGICFQKAPKGTDDASRISWMLL